MIAVGIATNRYRFAPMRVNPAYGKRDRVDVKM